MKLHEEAVMRFEEHCQESMRLFGDRFEAVHNWLDAFAGSPEYGMRHRKVRHHKEGITQIEKLYGRKAAEAARQHIISDLQEEGWSENDPFPQNEQHFSKMGLF